MRGFSRCTTLLAQFIVGWLPGNTALRPKEFTETRFIGEDWNGKIVMASTLNLHFDDQHLKGNPALQLIFEINSQLALFRDLLIHIGTARDSPELREKIRKLRRMCVDACKHTAQNLLPQIRSAVAEGIPADHPHLIIVFYMCQLFLRELTKCSRLVQLIPMDMTGYFENRAGPSNLGNVISQILLCKTIAPDFNQEEICSIAKDSQELSRLLTEMQEYLPTQDISSERQTALASEEGTTKWNRKCRRQSLYRNLGTFCCMHKHNYL